MMRRRIFIYTCMLLISTAVLPVSAQNTPGRNADTKRQQQEEVVRFTFHIGSDTLYLRGNEAGLSRLYSLTDEYRAEISSGKMPLCVDGYCASLPSKGENLRVAFLRANRVKSELISKKGLKEEHFITSNRTEPFEGMRDVVVVTLRIPAKEEARQPAPVVTEPERKQQPPKEQKPEPVVEKQPGQPVIHTEPAAPSKPYLFALRTNLLYDAFLLPALGVEWRVSNSVGVKLDGSRSWWGSEHGKVQKIWLVNPEVRWYLLDNKRFYVGAAANFGEYNIYKGMIGGMFSDNTGYQGKLWNAGLTAGYQLCLSRGFSLDFNLGLGYTRFEYDTFTVGNETRVYKEKDKTKNFWGPAQAGVNLVWTIGGGKQ